jgi:hypothetical protein
MKKSILACAILFLIVTVIGSAAISSAKLTDRNLHAPIVADHNAYLGLLIDNTQTVVAGEPVTKEIFTVTNKGTSNLVSLEIHCLKHCQGVTGMDDITNLDLGATKKSAIHFDETTSPGVHKMQVELKATWADSVLRTIRYVTITVTTPTPTPPPPVP